MLKKILTIPNTFDPDDRRRRQILNILLVFFIIANLFGFVIKLFLIGCNCVNIPITELNALNSLFIVDILDIALAGVLLVINRSPQVPGWLSGTIFLAYLILMLTQTDTPQELYNGRSLLVWVLPIMLGAVILRPGSVFIITLIICGLMVLFPPPNNVGVNYIAMVVLLMIAFISWLGMSIANRSIRDARRHAGNTAAILKNIADGVLVLDLNGNFLSANPALLNMIPENELVEMIAKPLTKTMRWKHKVFSVSVSEVPEIGMVAVFRDETRRHETERARDSLLATASHELRTPLTAVMNYLEFLQV